jgi:hypothetical protein
MLLNPEDLQHRRRVAEDARERSLVQILTELGDGVLATIWLSGHDSRISCIAIY